MEIISETIVRTNLDVKMIAKITNNGQTYVTCKINNNSVTPYVTWAMDFRGNVYWGHYHTDRLEAYADMMQRAGLDPTC